MTLNVYCLEIFIHHNTLFKLFNEYVFNDH